MYTVNDVAEFLLSEELEFHLFDLKVDDTYIWPIIRVKTMNRLEQALGLITTPHDAGKKWNRRERYMKALHYDTLAFHYHKHHDTILIEHPRKVNVDGEIIDIYTSEIKKQYPDALVINRLETNNLNIKNKGMILLQESVLDKYDTTCKKRLANIPHFYEFDILNEAIKQRFGIEFDMNALFIDSYKHFVLGEERFMRFLRAVKPKQVICVVAYDKYDVVSACKKCNVKIIELQHGIIDSHHLGYHYPNPIPQECFVDELWLFAPYWRLNAAIPLSEDNLKYIGFSYFRNESSKYQVERQANRITVLSQGTSGRAMLEQIMQLAITYPNLQINYKLHPGEFQNYKERYPELINPPQNITVYTNEKPLYELLKSSKYVIGAYSTAIYEGLALGCIGILIDVPGTREYMDKLIQNSLAYITDTLVDDFAFIENDSKKNEIQNIYF